MTKQAEHPSIQELTAFASGRLSESQAEDFERHIDLCGHSRRAMPKQATSRWIPRTAMTLRGGTIATVVSLALFLTSNLLGQPVAAQDADIRESVVKIKVTRVNPNFSEPWKRQTPRESGGTGAIIAGNRIITNAHVVGHAKSITVQGFQSDKKVTAKVIAISKGQDLAVLSVDDEEFFEDRPALEFLDELPTAKDKVNAYGFPIGGTQLSVTEGIVSRIDYSRYLASSEVQGLRIQVDAAINPGNSGGPAVKDGKIVGLVFSGYKTADNIGYLIPVEEIRLFLDDIEDGTYDGKLTFPRNCQLQTLENETLRRKLGLSEEMGGLWVREFKSGEETQDINTLRTGDVITEIDGEPIDRQGKVTLADGSRVSLRYLVQKHADSDMVPMTLLRDGEEIEADIKLRRGDVMLAKNMGFEYPQYIIVGPMAFTPVTYGWLQTLEKSKYKWANRFSSSQVTTFWEALSPLTADNEDVELVTVCNSFLPHPISKGYDRPGYRVVKKFNDIEVRNLKHLVELMRDSQQEYFVFEFVGEIYETYVFDREEFLAATEEVLDDNGIRRQGTPELLKIFNGESSE